MDILIVVLLAAVTFGFCFLVDLAYKKIFRSKQQHTSGLSVRLNKKYGAFGLIMVLLGIAAIFVGMNDSGWVLIAGGCLIILVGIGLIVYYMTFGIFYDADSFILTRFGKRSVTYRFDQIVGQQLYNASGNVLIELHMDDGATVGLQAAMTGVYPFLDIAFAGWCRQTGRQAEDCEFYDPSNSCWFPGVEVN